MELIVVTMLCIVIVAVLLKGVTINITVKQKGPEIVSDTDNLYDSNGDPKEDENEDYLEDLLKEVHELMEE